MVKEFRVHLKSANGPIDVYLCPDNIEAEAAADAPGSQPVSCATGTVLPFNLSSRSVGKLEGNIQIAMNPS